MFIWTVNQDLKTTHFTIFAALTNKDGHTYGETKYIENSQHISVLVLLLFKFYLILLYFIYTGLYWKGEYVSILFSKPKVTVSLIYTL